MAASSEVETFDVAWYLRPSVTIAHAAYLAVGLEPLTGNRAIWLFRDGYISDPALGACAATTRLEQFRAATLALSANARVPKREDDPFGEDTATRHAVVTQAEVAAALPGQRFWPATAAGASVDGLRTRRVLSARGEFVQPLEMVSLLAGDGASSSQTRQAARFVSCLLAGELKADSRSVQTSEHGGLLLADVRAVIASMTVPEGTPEWMTAADWHALTSSHHPDHPPELLIALRAWAELRRGEERRLSFETRFTKWYRENVSSLGLGTLNASALERCSRVANFGAGKTRATKAADASKRRKRTSPKS